MEEKESLLKTIFKVIKRRFKIWHLLFFALLISVNTYAWFIYMNKVSSDISVRVKSWNVSFQFNNQTMTDYVNFDVEEIYPGMETRTQSLKVSNDGETDAQLSYEVVYANIFGTEYDTGEITMTPEELTNKLANDYPFKITLSSTNNILSRNGTNEFFTVQIVWPYETTSNGVLQDDQDTYWGNLAYTFQEQNPGIPCIQIRVKITAIQIQNQESQNTEPASP
ncbi:MAG: hypothetical protein IJI49_02205 [Bacilli bacterium]|nr:hypothetical protein [Bacilli bacterium]